jgi:hypothetical protein
MEIPGATLNTLSWHKDLSRYLTSNYVRKRSEVTCCRYIFKNNKYTLTRYFKQWRRFFSSLVSDNCCLNFEAIILAENALFLLLFVLLNLFTAGLWAFNCWSKCKHYWSIVANTMSLASHKSILPKSMSIKWLTSSIVCTKWK